MTNATAAEAAANKQFAREFAQIDRLAPTRRPSGRPVGYHTWNDLSFLHWRVAPDILQPLLPRGLTLDLWRGEAWLGIVPFTLAGVHPRWFPLGHPWSAFCETNVRTYVHFRGRDPGVWFFSLDASKLMPVLAARWGWSLAYRWARMAVVRKGNRIRYTSRRRWGGTLPADSEIEVETGPLLGEEDARRTLPAGQALPGTLEHFLVERYVLYAASPRGELYQGFVHHAPYPLRRARIIQLRESLAAAAGVGASTTSTDPEHVLFSAGVNVEVFGLRPLAS